MAAQEIIRPERQNRSLMKNKRTNELKQNRGIYFDMNMRKDVIVLLLPLWILFVLCTSLLTAQTVPSVAEVPLELKSGYVIISIPEESFDSLVFLFDTGCQTTVLGEGLYDGLDKKPPLALRLGSEKLIITDYDIRSLSAISEKLGLKIDGNIGNDLLHRFTVKLDFVKSRMIFYDNAQMITSPEGEDIRLEVNPLVSSLPVRLRFPDGIRIDGDFVIDTGAPLTLLLNSPAAEKAGLRIDFMKSKNREFKTTADVQTAVEMVADSVEIGKHESEKVPLYVSTSEKGLFAVTRYAGIIGTGLLRNFNVILDYKRKRINLERID